jgi:hypothetical protein
MEPNVFLIARVAVEADGVLVDEDPFPGRQGRLVFDYLVAEQGRPVPLDELVSRHVGNLLRHPVSGTLIRQLWVG